MPHASACFRAVARAHIVVWSIAYSHEVHRYDEMARTALVARLASSNDSIRRVRAQLAAARDFNKLETGSFFAPASRNHDERRPV